MKSCLPSPCHTSFCSFHFIHCYAIVTHLFSLRSFAVHSSPYYTPFCALVTFPCLLIYAFNSSYNSLPQLLLHFWPWATILDHAFTICTTVPNPVHFHVPSYALYASITLLCPTNKLLCHHYTPMHSCYDSATPYRIMTPCPCYIHFWLFQPSCILHLHLASRPCHQSVEAFHNSDQ